MDPNAQFAALKSAVQGAQQQGAPTSTPLGDFPNIAKLYSSSYQLPDIQHAGAATANLAGDVVAKQQADQKAALQAQADKVDPNKYTQVPKADGGYAFLDPSGQEVSAYQYARITGKPLDGILQESQNPIDQAFVQDYKNLQGLLNAVRSGDTTTVDDAISAQPELEKYKNDVQGLTQRFQQAYPTVFGGNQNGNQSVNSTFVPSPKALPQ